MSGASSKLKLRFLGEMEFGARQGQGQATRTVLVLVFSTVEKRNGVRPVHHEERKQVGWRGKSANYETIDCYREEMTGRLFCVASQGPFGLMKILRLEAW